MMFEIELLKTGHRFKSYGAEFEVVLISDGLVRYSSVIGGKIFEVTTQRFCDLVNEGKYKFKEGVLKDEYKPSELTNKQVDVMNHRLHYIREINKKTTSTRSKAVVEPLLKKIAKKKGDDKPPPFTTFARWYKKYIDENKNPISVAPKPSRSFSRKKTFTSKVEEIISDCIEKYYLSEERYTGYAVYCMVIGEITSQISSEEIKDENIKIPSKRTIYRRIEKIDPYKKTKKRHGKYIANKKFKAAGVGISSSRILEKVQADGNVLDVLLVDEDTGEIIGRPYGTVLIDHYSRCIIAFVVTMFPFSSATLLKALKLAVSENSSFPHHGVFELLIVDNGSDYISSSARNFCNHLGISIDQNAPRDPDSKAEVERLFKTLNMQLIHPMPGTTRSNIYDRGDYDSEKKACFTLDKLNELILTWINSIYHKTPHQGHGRVPEKLWEESNNNMPVVTFPSESLEFIAREVVTRKISKGRITAHNLKWYAHSLTSIQSQLSVQNLDEKVEVYIDTLDLQKVYVRNPLDPTSMIEANSTKPEYTKNLSLFEHNLIRDHIKTKLKEDMSSYSEYELEIKRYEIYKQINSDGKKFANKRIARLKETKANKSSKDDSASFADKKDITLENNDSVKSNKTNSKYEVYEHRKIKE